MAVPNTFASATTSIPLANLDANFAYYDAAYSIVSTTITFNGIVKITGLTSGRVPYATTAGQITDSANLTFNGTTLTAAGLAGPFNGTVGATTASTGAFTTLSATGVTTVQAGTAALPAITPTGDTNTGIFFPAADTIAFSEGGAEAMRIDSSGNLGIGVTPNAWDTGGSKALQFAGGSLWAVNTTQMAVTQNLYYNSSGQFIYVNTATASAYRQISSVHSWWNAPSGTAGTTATLTQAMTLDASGGLLVGTTLNPNSYKAVIADDIAIRTTNDTAGVTNLRLGASTSMPQGIANVTGTKTAGGDGYLTFSTATGGTNNERMRITAAGDVGIGVVPNGAAVLEIKAGSATQAPLQLDAGTLMTTPVAGSVEFDGNAFYSTDDVTGGRGFIPSVHYFRLTADITAFGPAIANFFGATSGVTLDANTFYEVEANLFFTKTTAGTAVFTMTFSNAPINNDAWYVGTPVGGIGTVGGAVTAAIVKSTAAAGALPATGSLTTAVNHQYTLRAMFQSNATTGGTLNIQITSSAGTVTPLTGSYYKITRLPAANSGAFA